MSVEKKKKQTRKNTRRKTKKELLTEKNNSFSKEQKRENIEEMKKELPKNNKSKKEKNKGKKPKVITSAILQLLELCFATGMTDEEACYQAKISPSTLYNFQKENEWFLEKKQMLKSSVRLQAKINIGKSIMKGDLENSKWWLTKMDPEFGDSITLKGEVDPLSSKLEKLGVL